MTKRINGHVVRLAPLIKTLLQNRANQECLIRNLETKALEAPPALSNAIELAFILKPLNDEPLELLSEEAIIAWAEARRAAIGGASGAPENRLFESPQLTKYLEWLEEEDESDSDEEESDEEED